MTATLVIDRAGHPLKVILFPSVKAAHDDALRLVYSQDESFRAVKVCEGTSLVERWDRDERSGAWRHVQGMTIGSWL